MSTSPIRILIVAAAAFAAGCDAPGPAAPPANPAPATDVSPSPHAGSSFTVEWSGRISNPGGEAFAAGLVGIIAPDIESPPEDGGDGDGDIVITTPVLTFFRLGAGDLVSCGIIDFDSSGIIDPEILPAEVALNLIINPEIHEARFITSERMEGAIAGTFGAACVEEPVTGSTTGPRVRCAV